MSVKVDMADGVLNLEWERPERKNALDVATIRILVDALEEAATDDSLRVVLLRAAGPDFCSGADWVATNTGTRLLLRC